MKYEVLFSLKNNEKIFMNVISAVVIGALRVKNFRQMYSQLMLPIIIIFLSVTFRVESMAEISLHSLHGLCHVVLIHKKIEKSKNSSICSVV